MTADEPTESEHADRDHSLAKRREWRLFAFITVLLFPLLTIALVGAYGFSIWMYQLLAGPPSA